jgi:outer membrane protein OmpA-like peptidoglycan-associated protein
MRPVFAIAALALGLLPACDQELGAAVNTGTFGSATLNNTLIQSGERSATVQLQQRFAQEVPTTINFAFNSATLDPAAQAILLRQADWIRQFPEMRFSVFGHTDLVGSASYNYALGKRRAEAVVTFFAAQGISRSRLDALVSFGKTRPVVQTTAPEVLNRRTVTEVAGFAKNPPLPLNGKYAEVVFREYVASAVPPHPQNTVITTQIADGGSGG